MFCVDRREGKDLKSCRAMMARATACDLPNLFCPITTQHPVVSYAVYVTDILSIVGRAVGEAADDKNAARH